MGGRGCSPYASDLGSLVLPGGGEPSAGAGGGVTSLLSPSHVLVCFCLAATDPAKARGEEMRTELLPGEKSDRSGGWEGRRWKVGRSRRPRPRAGAGDG